MPERSANAASSTDGDLNAMFAPPSGALAYEPRQRVIARLANPDEAAAAVDALLDAGFPRNDVFVLCGEDAVRRLDPTGRHHGLRGRVVRAIERVFEAEDILDEDAAYLRSGGVIIAAPAHTADERATAIRVLREHGGTDMRYHGDLTWEEVG
jgi:hypothetical protein